MKAPLPIYLDYGATTPLDPLVADAMTPWGVGHFGNPHSAHRWGYEAAAAVAVARGHVANLIGANPTDVHFTSGATEAVNWAIKGVLTAPGATRRRIVTIATEHSCVLATSRYLQSLGAALTILPVAGDGVVALDDVAAAMGDDVALVSVMLVNNEIGVVQPIAEIAALAKACGAVMHCDGAQGFGKIAADVGALGVDLFSISGHKIYAPKGIGALYRAPGLELVPLLHGGGQEDGRSGTVPTALCVGLGVAAQVAGERMAIDAAHATVLAARLRGRLDFAYLINGSMAARWAGNLNIEVQGVEGSRLLSALRGLALSSGSACAAASKRPSHVLTAIGLSEAQARASLRIGWGRFTTEAEIDQAAGELNSGIARLRKGQGI
jgi:cysteine desulfurase